MKVFEIKETVEIVKGFYTATYHVEAETEEEALEKFNNRYDDDSNIEYLDTDFDIRDIDFLRSEIEEI